MSRAPDEILLPGEAPRRELDADELARLRAIAQLLDAAVEVPGTRVRLGLDALLGLLPGVGDLASAAFPAYLILHAARRHVPKRLLARMLANWSVDVAMGAIPLLGDFLDIGWKANLRNVALLERHLARAGGAGGSAERARDVTPLRPLRVSA